MLVQDLLQNPCCFVDMGLLRYLCVALVAFAPPTEGMRKRAKVFEPDSPSVECPEECGECVPPEERLGSPTPPLCICCSNFLLAPPTNVFAGRCPARADLVKGRWNAPAFGSDSKKRVYQYHLRTNKNDPEHLIVTVYKIHPGAEATEDDRRSDPVSFKCSKDGTWPGTKTSEKKKVTVSYFDGNRRIEEPNFMLCEGSVTYEHQHKGLGHLWGDADTSKEIELVVVGTESKPVVALREKYNDKVREWAFLKKEL